MKPNVLKELNSGTQGYKGKPIETKAKIHVSKWKPMETDDTKDTHKKPMEQSYCIHKHFPTSRGTHVSCLAPLPSIIYNPPGTRG